MDVCGEQSNPPTMTAPQDSARNLDSNAVSVGCDALFAIDFERGNDTLTGEPSERGFHSSVDTGTSSPASLRGSLMSNCETPRRRVESPKQGNNWRPRPDTSPLAGKYLVGRHLRNLAVGDKPTLRGLSASLANNKAVASEGLPPAPSSDR